MGTHNLFWRCVDFFVYLFLLRKITRFMPCFWKHLHVTLFDHEKFFDLVDLMFYFVSFFTYRGARCSFEFESYSIGAESCFFLFSFVRVNIHMFMFISRVALVTNSNRGSSALPSTCMCDPFGLVQGT